MVIISGTIRLQVAPVRRNGFSSNQLHFKQTQRNLELFTDRSQKFPGLKKISDEFLGMLGAFQRSTCGRFPIFEEGAIVSHGI
jgi:hypothetical protein